MLTRPDVRRAPVVISTPLFRRSLSEAKKVVPLPPPDADTMVSNDGSPCPAGDESWLTWNWPTMTAFDAVTVNGARLAVAAPWAVLLLLVALHFYVRPRLGDPRFAPDFVLIALLFVAASTRMILALGAMAWAHWMSSEISISQPES